MNARNNACTCSPAVNIRLTSTLTSDDENKLAPVLLTAFSSILDMVQIAYSIRIETSDSRVFQHMGSRAESVEDTERSLATS
jgi:hypothetical protein